MSETIYHGCYFNTETLESPKDSLLYATAPTPAVKEFLLTHEYDYLKNKDLAFLRCPSHQDWMKNVFAIKSWQDIELDVHKDSVSSEVMTQQYFDNYVNATDGHIRFYQIGQFRYFYTDMPSLVVSQYPAMMSDNQFTRDCMFVPGSLDIGKHQRSLSVGFKVRNGVKKISIKRGDTLYYLKLHTDKKLKLQEFVPTSRVHDLYCGVQLSGENEVRPWKPLQFYYDVFQKKNVKKLIKKEIIENLI